MAPIFGIEYPDPEKEELRKKNQKAVERIWEESGKAELSRLQTEVADCFLGSWTFSIGETRVGSASSSLLMVFVNLSWPSVCTMRPIHTKPIRKSFDDSIQHCSRNCCGSSLQSADKGKTMCHLSQPPYPIALSISGAEKGNAMCVI